MLHVSDPAGPHAAPKSDFDHLLRQISHQNVQVYKDEDGWYLLMVVHKQVPAPAAGGAAASTRPARKVCREYSNDYCEFDSSAEEGFEAVLHGYAALLKSLPQAFQELGPQGEELRAGGAVFPLTRDRAAACRGGRMSRKLRSAGKSSVSFGPPRESGVRTASSCAMP